jgi:hypothetical protein
MALTEQEIAEHKQLVEKVNSLSSVKQDIISTGKAKREQALEILKSYGYTELKDVSKLQEKLNNLEEDIKKERVAIEAEIVEINELKTNVDNILIG